MKYNYTKEHLLNVQFHTETNNPLIFRDDPDPERIRVYGIYTPLSSNRFGIWSIKSVNKALNGDSCGIWTLDSPLNHIAAEGDQVGGNHYGEGTDVFDFSLEREHDCLQHSAIKYIDRHKLKNGEEDIRKAISVLQRILQEQYVG